MQSQLKPFFAMQILDDAKKLEAKGAIICHMELGQPSAPFPQEFVKKGMDDFAHTSQGYLEAFGLKDLRRDIFQYYRRRHSIELGVQNIAVTFGASGALILALLAQFSPGDRIGLCRPGYPAYRNIAVSLGFECVDWVLDPDDGWAVTVASLKACHEKTPLDGIILASPSNPTGQIVDKTELAEIVRYCRSNDIKIVSDEIYHGLEFAEPSASLIEFDQTGMVINSFSKYYRMPGWRLGWLIVPDDKIERAQMLAQNLFLCAPVPAQHIARYAMRNASVFEEVKQGYKLALQALMQRLPGLGFDVKGAPKGAFYLYAGLGELKHRFGTATDFCNQLLQEAHVALTPGMDFDPVNGDDYIRLSFACGAETTLQALERIEAFLSGDEDTKDD